MIYQVSDETAPENRGDWTDVLRSYKDALAEHLLGPAALLALAVPAPAHASLPEPVRAMIKAAIATGDKAKVATVVELAKQTSPDNAEEIDTLQRAFLDRQAELTAAEARAHEEAIRAAGLFERWGGRGEVGATPAYFTPTASSM